MTPQEFVDLSAKLFKDMNAWIEEASKDGSLAAADLVLLNSAMSVVERVTLREAALKPESGN